MENERGLSQALNRLKLAMQASRAVGRPLSPAQMERFADLLGEAERVARGLEDLAATAVELEEVARDIDVIISLPRLERLRSVVERSYVVPDSNVVVLPSAWGERP